MRFLLRAVVVLAVFASVGIAVDKAVLNRAHDPATPEAQVRLAAAMAGLFAGGAAGSVVILILAFKRKG